MRNLFLYANYYYNFGFNLTHIVPKVNVLRNDKKNPFKSSTNDRTHLNTNRQSLSEIQSFDWENAVGIGTILGFNNLRAIDFDGCSSIEFMHNVLKILDLPITYEWLIKSGSNNGFHIVIYSNNHKYKTIRDRVKAFFPNTKNAEYVRHFELRWNRMLILPPSLSRDYFNYRFVNTELPLNPPQFIESSNIDKMVETLSAENNILNFKTVENYNYDYNEFLDFRPVDLNPPKHYNLNNNQRISVCQNATNYCNANVHNIINCMLGDSIKNNYIGGLFYNKSDYPTFENEQCEQYIQEYVPFHLPQISTVLEKVIDKFFRNCKRINLLDLASGPGTLPLALAQLYNRKKYKMEIICTTVEQSKKFNSLLKIFSQTNENKLLKFDELICGDIKNIELFDNIYPSFDWITIANGMSVIGSNNNFEYVNNFLRDLITKLLKTNDKLILTFIESGLKVFFNSPEYFEQIDKLNCTNFIIVEKIKVKEQTFFPEISNCKFYRTILDKNKPNIFSITIVIEKKKKTYNMNITFSTFTNEIDDLDF